jgi:hypothetical protein
LVSDSTSFSRETGTAQVGSTPDGSEIHTSILPHRTDGNINRATEPTSVLPPQSASGISNLQSIVVLPFANIGSDRENDYFSDG